MSFCIFIASSTATASPSFTSSPDFTGSLTMSPCMGAITVPSVIFGDAGAALPPAAGATLPAGNTARPAPLTRTLKTSPSTSTSNSAAVGAGGGGGSGASVTGSGTGWGRGGRGRRLGPVSVLAAGRFRRLGTAQVVRREAWKHELDEHRVVGRLVAHFLYLTGGGVCIRGASKITSEGR